MRALLGTNLAAPIPGTSSAWIKVSKAYTDFSAAARTNSITILSLPAGGIITAVKLKHSTAFSGGAISAYTISVGVGSTTYVAKYLGAFDVFQATGATVFAVSGTVDSESHSGAVNITATATSVGADLDAATAGVVDFWISYAIMT